jgi:hypothetical protein
MALRTSAGPNSTKTALFLSEVNRKGYIPSDLPRIRRKRSSTDVDDVFFEDIPLKGLVVNLDAVRENQLQRKRAQSDYQDLSEANKGSRISIYEPLKKDTIQVNV